MPLYKFALEDMTTPYTENHGDVNMPLYKFIIHDIITGEDVTIWLPFLPEVGTSVELYFTSYKVQTYRLQGFDNPGVPTNEYTLCGVLTCTSSPVGSDQAIADHGH
jgi:hypothetical protein